MTSIGRSVFRSCTGLADENGMNVICDVLYGYCGSADTVSIPENVTSIGENAFLGNNSLTSVTIPESVTSIDHDAFSCCQSLTGIVIPESVKTLGDNAFLFAADDLTIYGAAGSYAETFATENNIKFSAQ